MTVEFKNVKVTFSNLRNKLTKQVMTQGGRHFAIEVDVNSPEFKQLQEEFMALSKMAKEQFTENLGKKVKEATKENGVGDYLFGERDEKYGDKARLKFYVYNVNEVDVTQEDGSTKKELQEKLQWIYGNNPNFSYKLDNNGKKEFITNKGTPWCPLSENIVDVTCSLVAGYNKMANKVTIKLKAEEVRIIDSQYGSNNNGDKQKLICTLDDNKKISKDIEYTKPADVDFTQDEIAKFDSLEELDV